MPRSTRAMTFSLPPEMADSVNEVLKQQKTVIQSIGATRTKRVGLTTCCVPGETRVEGMGNWETSGNTSSMSCPRSAGMQRPNAKS